MAVEDVLSTSKKIAFAACTHSTLRIATAPVKHCALLFYGRFHEDVYLFLFIYSCHLLCTHVVSENQRLRWGFSRGRLRDVFLV